MLAAAGLRLAAGVKCGGGVGRRKGGLGKGEHSRRSGTRARNAEARPVIGVERARRRGNVGTKQR